MPTDKLPQLDHKVLDDGKRYYRVKWEGNWTPTWEAAHNISTALKDTYWKVVAKKGIPSLIGDNGQPEDLAWPDEGLQDAQVALHRFNRLSSSEDIVFRDLLNKEQAGCQEIEEEVSSTASKRPRRVSRRRVPIAKLAFAMRLKTKRQLKGYQSRRP